MNLIDFLVFNKEQIDKSKLRIALQRYKMLLIASQEAIQNFEAGKLDKFDPLVGECACELRAVRMAIIASRNSVNCKKVLSNILNVIFEINSMLEEKNYRSLINRKVSFFELIVNKNLHVSLSTEELYIISCYILSEAKITENNSDEFNNLCIKRKNQPKKLRKFGDVSSNFSEKLVRKLRKLIAENSVQWVREEAAKTEDSQLIRMVSKEFSILHGGFLLCTPMFWTYKVMLSGAQNAKIPLIIKTRFLSQNKYKTFDEDWLYFEPVFKCGAFHSYLSRQLEESDLQKSACIFEGVVVLHHGVSKKAWKRKILKYPITTVILSGAAAHPQFPSELHGNTTQCIANNEYKAYKLQAEKEGFSLDNPTTFFIQHVYASKVKDFVLNCELPGSPQFSFGTRH